MQWNIGIDFPFYRFKPGSDSDHFCKPTSVAPLNNGEFFVADGYCNSRIIHFSAKGEILKQFGQASQTIFGKKGILLIFFVVF